jgi:hypothetical protein
MPKAMDPNSTYRVVLACDKGKTPAPTFLYPYLTGRQQMAMMELYESVDGTNVQSQNMHKAFELAGMFLRGWENVTGQDGAPLAFGPDKLPEICSVVEAMELAHQVLFGQALDVMDKKKLDSPSASAMAGSAKPVPE